MGALADSYPEDKPLESLLDILKLGSVATAIWRSLRLLR